MKYATLILGAAILLALIGTANAGPKLPPEMHGVWCEARTVKSTTSYNRLTDDDGPEKINIGPNGFSTVEYMCEIVNGLVERGKYALTLKCSETPTNTWRMKLRMPYRASRPSRFVIYESSLAGLKALAKFS
jgi:hypothetical protein